MSLQDYYDNFASQPSRWSHEDPRECGCHGSGWFLSDLDTIHKCPRHNVGQPHPEDDIDYPTHALLCLTGFFASCKKVVPPAPNAEAPWDLQLTDDDIPF